MSDPAMSETVERAAELELIGVAIRAVTAGRGSTVILEGAAGCGKTHLLDCAAQTASAAGMRVLHSRAGPLATAASFAFVLDLLAPVLAARGRAGQVPGSLRPLLRGEGPAGADSAGDTAAHACVGLAQVCLQTASTAPLALLVDDLQWVDAASLAAIAAIAGRLREAPIVLVAALRSGEPVTDPAALAVIRGEPPAELISPGALSVEGVGRLLDLHGVEAGEEVSRACAEATGGNPLLVTRVAALLRGRAEPLGPAAVEATLADVATGVAATVLPRLRRLGPGAELVARACAVLEDDATAPRVRELAGVGSRELAAAIDGLEQAEILAGGEPLHFVHPLVREAVYGELPSGTRAREHAVAARLLAAEGVDPERVASHLLRALPDSSTETVHRLQRAAEQALRRGVPASAVAYLERALAEPASGEDRVRVLLGLGHARGLVGAPEAESCLVEAREASAEPRLRAEADLRLGRILYSRGDYAAAERAFERGVAELPPTVEDDLAVELRTGSLAAGRYAGSLAADDPRLASARAGSEPGATPAERALLAELAVEAGVRGDPREEVVALSLRAWAGGEMLEGADSQAIAVSQVAAALVWSDAYEEAERVLTESAERAEQVGGRIAVATSRYMRAWRRLYGGELAGAVADARAALGTEGWEMYEPAARSVLAHALIGQGQLEAAAEVLVLPGSDADWDRAIPFALTLEARGRVGALRGEHREALEDLLACGELVSPMGRHQPYSQWRLRAALCMHRLGDSAAARALLEEELVPARRAAAPRPLGMALAALGTVVGGERGLEHLEEARDVLAPSPARLAHARALTDLGAHLRRLGRGREAREPLREALSAAEGMGAALIAERAASELTAAGGRPRRRALRGPAALTPAELRTARLAAVGRSNREIAEELVVSSKTVQFHLSNVYRKLGIASREDLVAALD